MSGHNAGKTPGRGPKAAQGCHSITKFFKRVDSKAVAGSAGREVATPSVSAAAQPAAEGAGVECNPTARRQSVGAEPTSQKRKAEREAQDRGTPGADPGSTAKRCASTGPATGGGRPVPYRAAAAQCGTSLLAAFSQAEGAPGSPGLPQLQQEHSATLAQQAEQHTARLAQLEQEKTAALAQQAEQHAAQCAERMQQFTALQEAEASLRQQLAAAQGQLAAGDSRIVQLELELATARQQLTAVEARLAGEQQAARQQAAGLERQLEVVQGELAGVQQAAKMQAAELEGRQTTERLLKKAAESEAEQLRQRCEELDATVASLQADVARLAEQQAAAASQARSWQHQAEEATAQVAALQQQLESAQAGAAGAAAAIGGGKRWAEQVQELSEELQKLRDRHNTLKEELAVERWCRAEAAVAARVREERLQRLCDDVARQLALARREKADLQQQLETRQQGGGAGLSDGKRQACAGSARQPGSAHRGVAAAPAGGPNPRPGNREAIRAAICSLGEVKSSERGSVVGRAQAVLAAQGVKAAEEEILAVRMELDHTVKLVNKGNEWVYCYSQAQS